MVSLGGAGLAACGLDLKSSFHALPFTGQYICRSAWLNPLSSLSHQRFEKGAQAAFAGFPGQIADLKTQLPVRAPGCWGRSAERPSLAPEAEPEFPVPWFPLVWEDDASPVVPKGPDRLNTLWRALGKWVLTPGKPSTWVTILSASASLLGLCQKVCSYNYWQVPYASEVWKYDYWPQCQASVQIYLASWIFITAGCVIIKN